VVVGVGLPATGYLFTKILAARSDGSSEIGTLSIFGLRPSSSPALTEIAVLPWPVFAYGLKATPSAGRRPKGMEQGIAA
jgi:hypothetical protein